MDGRMRWRSAVGDHRVVVIADVDLAADRSLEQPGGQVLVVYLFTEKQRTLDGTHVSRRFELDRGEFGEFRFVHQAGPSRPRIHRTQRRPPPDHRVRDLLGGPGSSRRPRRRVQRGPRSGPERRPRCRDPRRRRSAPGSAGMTPLPSEALTVAPSLASRSARSIRSAPEARVVSEQPFETMASRRGSWCRLAPAERRRRSLPRSARSTPTRPHPS